MASDGLRFDLYERVHLGEDQPGMHELEELELMPQITASVDEREATLRGELVLKGAYVSNEADRRICTLQHVIPVEISVSVARVPDPSQLQAEIEEFDVDLLSARTLDLNGVLVLRGVLANETSPLFTQSGQEIERSTSELVTAAPTAEAEHVVLGVSAAESEEGEEAEAAEAASTEAAEAASTEAAEAVTVEASDANTAEPTAAADSSTALEATDVTAEPAEEPAEPAVEAAGSAEVEAAVDAVSEAPHETADETVRETAVEVAGEAADETADEAQEEAQVAGEAVETPFLVIPQPPRMAFRGRRDEDEIPPAEPVDAELSEPPMEVDAETQVPASSGVDWKNRFLQADEQPQSTALRLVIVQRDETVEQIAERYEMHPGELLLYNRVQHDEIKEGAILHIPVSQRRA